MNWYIQQGPEIVTIFDALDHGGNGNIRFKGTIECALTMFAFSMQECDDLRKQRAELNDKVVQLQTQLGRIA